MYKVLKFSSDATDRPNDLVRLTSLLLKEYKFIEKLYWNMLSNCVHKHLEVHMYKELHYFLLCHLLWQVLNLISSCHALSFKMTFVQNSGNEVKRRCIYHIMCSRNSQILQLLQTAYTSLPILVTGCFIMSYLYFK